MHHLEMLKWGAIIAGGDLSTTVVTFIIKRSFLIRGCALIKKESTERGITIPFINCSNNFSSTVFTILRKILLMHK